MRDTARKLIEAYRVKTPGPDAAIRTYGEHIFIFRQEAGEWFLVTVWQMPGELRPALRRAFRHAVAA